uniref:hypothetical protein n=1 Tax=uncultured Draconibacterium sp. TaxID=1573823 RepID=UPI003216BBE1
MPNFKKMFGGLSKPKPIRLEFTKSKTKLYSSRKLLIIGDWMYFRKDLVEQKITEVINTKIANGELKEVKKGKSEKEKSKSESK